MTVPTADMILSKKVLGYLKKEVSEKHLNNYKAWFHKIKKYSLVGSTLVRLLVDEWVYLKFINPNFCYLSGFLPKFRLCDNGRI